MKSNTKGKKSNLSIKPKEANLKSSQIDILNQNIEPKKNLDLQWDSEIKQIMSMLLKHSPELCQEKMIELVVQKINVGAEEKEAITEFLKLYLDLSPINLK